MEHLKTSHKLSKIIRQAKSVGTGRNSDSSFYNETTASEKFLNEKNCKNNKTISCL